MKNPYSTQKSPKKAKEKRKVVQSLFLTPTRHVVDSVSKAGHNLCSVTRGVAMRRTILVVAFSLVLTHSFLTAQTTGHISGTVIAEDGTVVDHMKVSSSVTSGNTRSINCVVPVDGEGHFQIEDVKFGSLDIFAVNEEEGYSIGNQSPGVKVSVTPENPSPFLTIRLRPRGGILIGSVTDKLSGKAVDDANINYITIDNGGGGGSQRIWSGQFSMTVPTENSLLVYVSANGYKGWVYTDASNPGQPVIKLASGERKVLDIELEPLAKTSGER